MGDSEKRLTALVVDDEETVRTILCRTISKAGYDTLEAEDGIEAVKLLEQSGDGIDIIISDLMMPKMDGIKLAEYNFLNDRLPFVVCTAIADAAVALRLTGYGVQDYIIKPVVRHNLTGIAESAITRSQLAKGEPDGGIYDGNIGSVSIPSKFSEIKKVNSWMQRQVEAVMDKKDAGQFIGYVTEFLINAHEHGNLHIGEGEKAGLIEQGRLQEEILLRETDCGKQIEISFSMLESGLAVKITDFGDGFDHERYMTMDTNDLLNRFAIPNGRGIYMSRSYFDSITYEDNGRTVTLMKSLKESGDQGLEDG